MLTVQDYSLFAYRGATNLFRPPIYWSDFLMQSDIIGVGSASIVLLSGFFTGGVLALQSAATLAQFGATAVTGQIRQRIHDSRTRPGAHRHHGLRPECLLDGQRTRLHGRDRAD